MEQKRLVVIGGGTGSFVLLTGLKAFPLQLTAIVPVTDDGGSTGRLRDEFGFLPVGDMRQCLAALAPDNGLLRKLLLYRFEKGEGLVGHNLGNLLLTALEDLAGSEPEAVIEAAKIFRLKGKVWPISKTLVKLGAQYTGGKTIVSEHEIEDHRLGPNERITRLFTIPDTIINPEAKAALVKAEAIIFAPGDLFNSVIASLVIKGTKEAIKASKAKLIYVVNLMTLNSQTNYMTAADHVKAIEKYAGRSMDKIVINSQAVPDDIKRVYAKEVEYPVVDDLGDDARVVRREMLAKAPYQKPKSDVIKRSLLRHDPGKLAQTIIKLIND